MTTRRLAREVALKVLFQVDVGKARPAQALQSTLEETPALNTPEGQAFARKLVEGTLSRLAEIDGWISRFAVGWSLDRMANVDRNVLRMAIYEILYMEEIPHGVTINEAVELAKRYGTEESGKFVNGILGNVVRSLADA